MEFPVIANPYRNGWNDILELFLDLRLALKLSGAALIHEVVPPAWCLVQCAIRGGGRSCGGAVQTFEGTPIALGPKERRGL